MRFLAHFDPRTFEPLGLWSFTETERPELLYADDQARSYAEDVATVMKPEGWVEKATAEDWLDFAQYLTERTPWYPVEQSVEAVAQAGCALRYVEAGAAPSLCMA